MNTLGPGLQRARQAMITAGVDAVLVGSPELVASLTGHVIPLHLAYLSRDGRLEKPTLALVTHDGLATICSAAGLTVIDVLRYEGFQINCLTVGEYARDRFAEISRAG